MRAIDGESLHMGVCLYLAQNAYLNDTPQSALEMVARWIEKEPTLDVLPVRHAHIVEFVKDGKMIRLTSCCDADLTKMTMWMTPKFCPCCGAKMRA